MKIRSCPYKVAVYCALIAISISMTACNDVPREIGPEGVSTIAHKNVDLTHEARFVVTAQGGGRDLPDWKLRDKQIPKCLSCHTTCVNSKHCIKFGDAWNTTNCMKCHTSHPIKGDQAYEAIEGKLLASLGSTNNR
jgi:hypothetical protein